MQPVWYGAQRATCLWLLNFYSVRLFEVTPWNGADALPERLLDDIRDRTIVTNKEAVFEGWRSKKFLIEYSSIYSSKSERRVSHRELT
jgi:hypothetical protein